MLLLTEVFYAGYHVTNSSHDPAVSSLSLNSKVNTVHHNTVMIHYSLTGLNTHAHTHKYIVLPIPRMQPPEAIGYVISNFEHNTS